MNFKLNSKRSVFALSFAPCRKPQRQVKGKDSLTAKTQIFKPSSKKMLVFFGSLAAQRHGNLFSFKLLAANL